MAEPSAGASVGLPDPQSAFVHLASDYSGTALELRNYVDAGAWRRVCVAPCDRKIVAFGSEVRVTAPGMTTSNVFRLEPGPGVALIKVDGGSSLSRTLGIVGLVAGIPLGLGGTAMYSYGTHTDRDGLALAGGFVLGTGAVLMLAAIPLLLSGTTNVRDGRGKLVALDRSTPAL